MQLWEWDSKKQISVDKHTRSLYCVLFLTPKTCVHIFSVYQITPKNTQYFVNSGLYTGVWFSCLRFCLQNAQFDFSQKILRARGVWSQKQSRSWGRSCYFQRETSEIIIFRKYIKIKDCKISFYQTAFKTSKDGWWDSWIDLFLCIIQPCDEPLQANVCASLLLRCNFPFSSLHYASQFKIFFIVSMLPNRYLFWYLLLWLSKHPFRRLSLLNAVLRPKSTAHLLIPSLAWR